MAGFLSTQASASCPGSTPASRASALNARSRSRTSPPSFSSSHFVSAPRLPGGTPSSYFPVSKPPARGLQTTSPIPSRWAVGSTEASIPRSSRLYWGCSTSGG